jgi:hypothetical protein
VGDWKGSRCEPLRLDAGDSFNQNACARYAVGRVEVAGPPFNTVPHPIKEFS